MTLYVEVPLRVANAQAVSERNPALEVRKALTAYGKFGRPWLVALCEVSPLQVRDVADDLGFGTVQRGHAGSAPAGVAICHNRRHVERLRDVRLKVGSPATREGGGIRMRPILTERYRAHDGDLLGHPFDLSAIHNPPGRANEAQDDFMADVRQTDGVIAGDFNETVQTMKRTTGRQYRGIKVLGAIVPEWIEVSQAWPVGIDSDHAGVDLLLRIPARRR